MGDLCKCSGWRDAKPGAVLCPNCGCQLPGDKLAWLEKLHAVRRRAEGNIRRLGIPVGVDPELVEDH